MIFETVAGKVLDLCIGAFKERKLRRKTFFQDFIEPLYAQMEQLHANYLDCFGRYREMLAIDGALEGEDPSIFDVIQRDHVFSQHVWSKVDALRTLRFKHAQETDPVTEMIGSIDDYVSGANGELYYWDEVAFPNSPRASLLFGLKSLSSLNPEGITDGQSASDWFWDRLVMPVRYNFSKAQEDNALRALRAAGENQSEIRKALSIALVDALVGRNQRLFGEISDAFVAAKQKAYS